jgi:glycosyltransferase involved in cell wall biosynthesis
MKYIKLSLFFLLICSFSLFAEDHPTVCLNMIVKNEKEVICRCLTSVKPLIDYWVIVDTGSTDGTQQIIKDFLKDIPGELHEQPWKNFGYNRNQALELAKGKGDYVLIIDADDIFEYPKDYRWPHLTLDGYFIQVRDAGTNYDRFHLINNHIHWKWIGVLHEAIGSNEVKAYGRLEDITYKRIGGGDRSKDPKKYLKDAQILEEALKEEPSNSRYVFYLAQSYKDAGDYPKAIENYEKRALMGGWQDEIFWSKFSIACMKEFLNKDETEIIDAHKEAYQCSPIRGEPLYHMAAYYRKKENYTAGYNVSLKGLNLKIPSTALFLVEGIYTYGLLLEYSICAYYVGKYNESWLASQWLLTRPDIPNEVRECVNQNLKWISAKFPEQGIELNSTPVQQH